MYAYVVACVYICMYLSVMRIYAASAYLQPMHSYFKQNVRKTSKKQHKQI